MKWLMLIVLVIGGLSISSGCARLRLWTRAEKEVEEIEEVTPYTVKRATTYVVKKGDSLWKIAGSVYGDPYKWKIIHEANRDKLTNPNSLKPGMVLVIPQD